LEKFSKFSISLNWKKEKKNLFGVPSHSFTLWKKRNNKKDVGNNNTLPNFHCKENKEHKNKKGNGKWKGSPVLGLF
jgi:hypothetical protein